MNSLNLNLALETLIDKHTLANILAAIAQTCFAKNDHLTSNWNDRAQGHLWETIGRAIDRQADRAIDYSI